MKGRNHKITILLYLCTCVCFTCYAQNSVKDSLIQALSQARTTDSRLEILTNLSDAVSNRNDVTYSHMLWNEAIAAGNNDAASAAIIKILVSKLDNNETDSLFYYIEQARTHLTPPSNQAISTYYEIIYEARRLQGIDSDECNKIIANATEILKNEDNKIDKFERMKNLYIIICSISRIMNLKGNEELGEQILYYAKEMLQIARTVPLESGGNLYMQQALMVCCNSYSPDTPEYAEYTLQQLNVFENHQKLPAIQKRPFYSQRSRIRAYGVLALALVLPQSDRDLYFSKFRELLQEYPSQAPTPPASYYLPLIGYQYYLEKKDTLQALRQMDSILKYNPYPLLSIPYLKEKANVLSETGKYKEAYQEYIKATQLSDSLSRMESDNKYQELQALYEVNATKLKNVELRQHNQKITIVAGIIILLLLLGWGFYNYYVRRKMQKLNEKIQESETVKSAFLHSMCHEIRTPLNIISGFTTMALISEIDDEEKESMAEEIERQTGLLTKMLDDMLEVSKLDSSEDLLPTEPTNIYLECEYSINKFAQLYKDQKWILNTDNTNQVIRINRSYFNQLIDNILSNAAKFSEPGSKTTLSYTIDNEKHLLNVCVADTGIGIPKDKQKWVFERFTKIDEFKQGAGLGLYVCQLIVKRMGGNIYIDGSYNQGTKVIISIPVTY